MTEQSIVFMYSGQGSQYYQMGKELYENHPRFRLWMDHCNSIVEPMIGNSLIDVIYYSHSKDVAFDTLRYSNPAIVSFEYSLSRVLMEQGIQPDYLLGYSLGEVVSAIVSGALSLEDGLQLTVDIAEIVERDSPPASMLAIIESKRLMEDEPDWFANCWLTGSNFNKNFVVSGLKNDIAKLQSHLGKKFILSQILPVNYGFHTPVIEPLEEQFRQIDDRLNVFPVRIPVISSLKTEVIEEYHRDYFWQLVRQPVRFEETIEKITQQDDFLFIDLGPSGSLATFVKYILPQESASRHIECINQFGKDLQSMSKLNALFSAKAIA